MPFVLSLLGLAGLGFLVWLPLLGFDRVSGLRWSDGGIVMVSGILLFYLYSLIAVNWSDSWYYPAALAVIGWIAFGLALARGKKYFPATAPRFRWRWLVFFFLLTGIYFSKIVSDPLWAYDARSIWFFAAKIIYFANGIGTTETWAFPDSNFYHFDYPKLIPVLAARTASAAGFWNEYIPKLSLLVILMPAILFLYDFKDKSWSAAFLFFSFLGIPGSLLWIGYMDGYLAVYAGLAALFWLHARETGSLRHFAVSLLSCVMAAALKEEGKFFVAIFTVVVVASSLREGFRISLFRASVCLSALVPAALWSFVRAELHLTPDPDFLSGDIMGRVSARCASGELYEPILASILYKAGLLKALVPLSLCFLLALYRRIKFSKLPWLPLVAGMAYTVFLVFVYLVTPLDLAGHVISSVERTMLPVVMMAMVSAAWAIRAPSK